MRVGQRILIDDHVIRVIKWCYVTNRFWCTIDDNRTIEVMSFEHLRRCI